MLRKKLSRKQLLTFTANRTPMLIGMEACSGAHYLARTLWEQGHDARLMPAQYVKPYVKTNKNDYLDAEAIAEAVQRPTIRFRPDQEQCATGSAGAAPRAGSLGGEKTAAMNYIRGFLLDRGIAIRKGPSYLAAQLQILFTNGDSAFSGRLLHLIRELKHEWNELERKIKEASAELARIAKLDEGCHRLMEVPGFGTIVSTALVAAIGNGISFRKRARFGSLVRAGSTTALDRWQNQVAWHQQAGQ